MARRIWTVARIEEIKRYIAEGLSDRKIAQVMKCRRRAVRALREGMAIGPGAAPQAADPVAPVAVAAAQPGWATTVDWAAVEREIISGHEFKRIWEERAAEATSYPNFWKQLQRRYGHLLTKTVSLREFAPGGHCEVDWSGKGIAWRDRRGRIHEARIFVGILCHSQLIFAAAVMDEKKGNWLTCHERMYQAFGGVPRVTVPDNLKAGVKRTHLYDPDLNPEYMELSRHYNTAVVPARVRRPKDKALVENAVGLVMRLLRWMYRDRAFISIDEVNGALTAVCARINDRTHTRFKISRRQRFDESERAALKPLPATRYERIEWKTARVHPDCTVAFDSNYYSAPYIHRGKEVRVKATPNQVELWLEQERIALHIRHKSRDGTRVIDSNHLPENSRAYRDATAQSILHRARFAHIDLHALIEQLFNEDTLGHLRRALGLVRLAHGHIERFGRAAGEEHVAYAVAQCIRFNKVRVRYFDETLKRVAAQKFREKQEEAARKITRLPGNPMLRHRPDAADGTTTEADLGENNGSSTNTAAITGAGVPGDGGGMGSHTGGGAQGELVFGGDPGCAHAGGG